MPVSLDFLLQRTNTLISRKSQPTMQQMAEIAGIINAVNTASVFSTSSFSVLPNASLNKGRFIYLTDVNRYVYSDGMCWTNNFCTVTSATSSLWVWGANTSFGALGDGTTTNRCSPVREFCSASDWFKVSGGCNHTIALKNTNQIWTWGSNNQGQLGTGSTISSCSPVREFCSATDWCKITNTGYGNIAIKTSGQIWSWGNNPSGSLGIGGSPGSTICSPTREFCSATDWCEISSEPSGPSVGAIKTSGQLWVWGENNYGRLGDGTTVSRCSPVREFCSATDWCQVSMGSKFSAAVKTNGQLWSWGRNAYGQLGNGCIITVCSPIREFCSATDWCLVNAAFNSTFAIKYSGELWVWGSNSCNTLGTGQSTNACRCSPVREFCSATNWCNVCSFYFHVLALKTSGELWGWGRNDFFQLGDNSTITRCSPVREFCSATDWCYISVGKCASFAIKRGRGFNAV